MEIIINGCYGGFQIPSEMVEKIGARSKYDDSAENRTNPMLIEWVKNHEEETDLCVVAIPSEATDFRIEEYDGCENVIAVVNGKIVDLGWEED